MERQEGSPMLSPYSLSAPPSEISGIRSQNLNLEKEKSGNERSKVRIHDRLKMSPALLPTIFCLPPKSAWLECRRFYKGLFLLTLHNCATLWPRDILPYIEAPFHISPARLRGLCYSFQWIKWLPRFLSSVLNFSEIASINLGLSPRVLWLLNI